MSKPEINRKEFWERKILGWEKIRYAKRPSWLEPAKFLSWRSSSSVRYRMQLSQSLLTRHVAGKSVIEVGCGSGTLAEPLVHSGAKSYMGIDLAESAIVAARERVRGHPEANKIRFEVGGIDELAGRSADIVVSLGLLDWLKDEEIQSLFSFSKDAEFLHSFSEHRNSPSQILHRLYVYLSYGHRSHGYTPRYLTVRQIAEITGRTLEKDLHTIRSPQLTFGTFLTTFALDSANGSG